MTAVEKREDADEVKGWEREEAARMDLATEGWGERWRQWLPGFCLNYGWVLTPFTEVESRGGWGWKVSPFRVLWIRGTMGPASGCLTGSCTLKLRRDISGWQYVTAVEIMGLVCYFACPELVLAGALNSHAHIVGMTFGAPEESLHGT